MSWWTAPSGATAVAAYDPIQGSSLADSYVNRANPGTNNAAPGTAPSWAYGTGWSFNGTTQYLTTGVTPTSSWSVVARMSNVTQADVWAFGNYNASGWGIQPRHAGGSGTGTYYYNGNTRAVVSARTAGVWAMAAGQGYFDGAADGAPFTPSASLGAAIFIGDISGAFRRYFNGSVAAFALYNSALTADDVTAITAAMNALPSAASSAVASIVQAHGLYLGATAGGA